VKKHFIITVIFVYLIISTGCGSINDIIKSSQTSKKQNGTTTKTTETIETTSIPTTVTENTTTKNTTKSTTTENVNETQNDYIYNVSPASGCKPSDYGITWDIIVNDKIIKNYESEDKLLFPTPSDYTDISGVSCFRGNNWRDNSQFGFVEIKEKKLEEIWFFKTGYAKAMGFLWPGIGWTGQAAIVKWDDSIKQKMNIYTDKKKKENLVEVICSSLDGNIYFLDMEDGKPTRPHIELGFSYKGSVTVDPRGYPILYAGQGLKENEAEIDDKSTDESENKLRIGKMGYWIYSLIDQSVLYFIDGDDKFSYRKWGAFDSGGLIDKKSDTLVLCGENGILYIVKLNTVFKKETGDISVNPEITRYRYNTDKYSPVLGMENSPAIFENYIYFADNSGLMQCIDLNTLKPVWVRYLNDDTDSSTVIEANGSNISLYTACQVDLQKEDGYSYIRKLDALSGEILWEKSYKCDYNKINNVGILSTPVLGKNDIKDLVIYGIAVSPSNKDGGKLVALNKENGEEVWRMNIDFYSWSSPTAVYTEDGKSYIIYCDAGGHMYLIEGTTGKVLDTLPLLANVEASPAIYGNTIVIGTKGQRIVGVKIK
jgi:hypothetical protein